jgi:hypothetical protein
MPYELKTAREIADAITEQAYQSLGPWPRDLELFIFGGQAGWTCGMSPATTISDQKYREGVLQIARELKKQIQLVRWRGDHSVR